MKGCLKHYSSSSSSYASSSSSSSSYSYSSSCPSSSAPYEHGYGYGYGYDYSDSPTPTPGVGVELTPASPCCDHQHEQHSGHGSQHQNRDESCSGSEEGCLHSDDLNSDQQHHQQTQKQKTQHRKCVAFEAEEGLEEIHMADEWDRTPTQPARGLSYQDLLELKEIQLSLPRANQHRDPHTGKSGSHYLSGVPIGLLPLLSSPASSSSSSSSSGAGSGAGSPCTTGSGSGMGAVSSLSYSAPWISQHPIPPPTPTSPVTSSSPLTPTTFPHPAHLSHLPPGRPQPVREKPRFAFLPLLDAPPVVGCYSDEDEDEEESIPHLNLLTCPTTSVYAGVRPSISTSTSSAELSCSETDADTDTDTDADTDMSTPSLTNDVSLDSTPPSSRGSSCSPGVRAKEGDSYFPAFSGGVGVHEGKVGERKGRGGGRKRNFIVVNDMEIELDGDDDDEAMKEGQERGRRAEKEGEEITPPASTSSSCPSSRNHSPLPLGSSYHTQSHTPAQSQSYPKTPAQPQPPPQHQPTLGLHTPIRFKRFIPPPPVAPAFAPASPPFPFRAPVGPGCLNSYADVPPITLPSPALVAAVSPTSPMRKSICGARQL